MHVCSEDFNTIYISSTLSTSMRETICPSVNLNWTCLGHIILNMWTENVDFFFSVVMVDHIMFIFTLPLIVQAVITLQFGMWHITSEKSSSSSLIVVSSASFT